MDLKLKQIMQVKVFIKQKIWDWRSEEIVRLSKLGHDSRMLVIQQVEREQTNYGFFKQNGKRCRRKNKGRSYHKRQFKDL